MLKLRVDGIQVIEPGILGDFIAALPPDPLLGVQSRLVRGKILQVNNRVAFQKKPDSFTFMPAGPIDVKPDIVTGKLLPDMLQDFQEALRITAGSSDQSLLAQERGDPAEQIKPLAVLAGSGDTKTLAFLGPATPQTRMKAKTGFILKNDGLIGLQRLQFFLTPVETRGPLFFEPERRHSWPVSGCNLTGASSSALGGLSASRQNAPSGKLPASVRPRQPEAGRIYGDFLSGPPSNVAADRDSAQRDDPDGASVSGLGSLPYLPDESSAPVLWDLAQTKRLSIPDAGPPKPAIRRRSLCRSTPPGLALPRLAVSVGSLPCQPKLKPSQRKDNTNCNYTALLIASVLVQECF